MTANIFTAVSHNFRRIKRVLLDTMYGGESHAEYPWELDPDGSDPSDAAPEDGPLAFGPGAIWFDYPKRTIRVTYEPYDASTGGIPENPAGEDAVFDLARKVVVSLPSGSQTYTVEHDLAAFFPHVQVYQRNISNEWFLYDVLAGGGTIQQSIVSFGGAGGDIVIDFGATTTADAVAVLVG